MTGWPEEAVLWQSVVSTLEDEVLPALDGPAQAVALQLSGLARFALGRGHDPGPERARRVAALTGLQQDCGWPEVAAAAGDLLAAARRDPAAERPEVGQIRAALVELVSEDLERSAPLLETFARHGLSLVGEDATPPAERAALEKWFSERLGQPVRHLAVRLISGGHSRRMLDVTVTTDRGEQPFVVRVEQGGVFGTDGTTEAAIMQALAAAGVAVAPVRWVEESSDPLGHPFFVMDRVEGHHEVDDASLTMFVRALDALHRMPPGEAAAAFPVRPVDPDDGVRTAIDHWYEVYRAASPDRLPLLDDAAAWLQSNLHPTGPLCVVHGDPGPGNFIHRDGELAAFTDWEFGHLGDAAEDWVYLAAMRGVRIMPTEEWVPWLKERVGIDYDQATWRAWKVFNLFKGACANITALAVFTRGVSRGPNLLAVGTALHLRMVRQLTELISTPCGS